MSRRSLVIGHWSLVLSLAASALTGIGAAENAGANGKGQATGDIQDFVFLAETRPILVRLRVALDGRPFQDAWDDFMKYLFGCLDANGDGTLDRSEAERAPSVEQLGGGGLGRGAGGFGRGGAAGPSLAALDNDKDGKVVLAELSAWYRKSGFAPFKFQLQAAGANPLGMAAAALGGQAEPSPAEVSDAIFKELDTGNDGRLTREKLAAAPALLLRFDEDEDEMILARELVRSTEAVNPFAGLMMMGRGAEDASAINKYLIPIAAAGEVPAALVKTLQDRYGRKGDNVGEKKLSRKDLGLEEELFARLDVNGDGSLDGDELAGFVKRAPDLEVAVRLGRKGAAEGRVGLLNATGRPAQAGKVQMKDGRAVLDLGPTWVDLLGGEATTTLSRFDGLVRDQYLAGFRQLDRDGKGFVVEEQAKKDRLLRNLFKAIDRDGDGKATEKELNAYLDHLQEMTTRATAACVTLQLSDQGRGLFDVLDADRDGRLSVREMRGAVKLLEQLARDGNGFLTKADVPRIYRLTVRPGPAAAANLGSAAAFLDLYGGSTSSGSDGPTRGPLWFRKMDRNRDGDVSRKEWLWSAEVFRKIDTDGDGLIGVEEAEKQGKTDR